uniref:Uncharacterized protein n=1 Tax=Heterorhabditis bacteriophora TaxID=37862 RepID=A0A1I7WDW7_HETBA
MAMCENSRKIPEADGLLRGHIRCGEFENTRHKLTIKQNKLLKPPHILLCQMLATSLNQIFHILRNEFQMTDIRRGHLVATSRDFNLNLRRKNRKCSAPVCFEILFSSRMSSACNCKFMISEHYRGNQNPGNYVIKRINISL